MKGNESAYPLAWESRGNHGDQQFNEIFGMSVRLKIAAMAMQGLTLHPNAGSNEDIAKWSLELADALLKQEEETK